MENNKRRTPASAQDLLKMLHNDMAAIAQKEDFDSNDAWKLNKLASIYLEYAIASAVPIQSEEQAIAEVITGQFAKK